MFFLAFSMNEGQHRVGQVPHSIMGRPSSEVLFGELAINIRLAIPGVCQAASLPPPARLEKAFMFPPVNPRCAPSLLVPQAARSGILRRAWRRPPRRRWCSARRTSNWVTFILGSRVRFPPAIGDLALNLRLYDINEVCSVDSLLPDCVVSGRVLLLPCRRTEGLYRYNLLVILLAHL